MTTPSTPLAATVSAASWAGILTGLFCVPELSWTDFGGLFYTGDPTLLIAQVLGIAVTIAIVLILDLVLVLWLRPYAAAVCALTRQMKPWDWMSPNTARARTPRSPAWTSSRTHGMESITNVLFN